MHARKRRLARVNGGAGPAPAPVDEHWDKVRLLYHFDSLANESSVAHADLVATVGGALVTGDGYLQFETNNKGLMTPMVAGDNFAAADWTVEGFVEPTAFGTWLYLFENSVQQARFRITDTGRIQSELYLSGAGGFFEITTHHLSVALNEINHIAFCRFGTAILLFVNGVGTPVENLPPGFSFPLSGNWIFGGEAPVGAGGVLKLHAFRYTLGVARYTEDFEPPTEPFPTTGAA